MKVQAQHPLPTYKRVGNYYCIYINETITTNQDGETIYQYDSCKVPILSTRNERIEALIATRYTIPEELAAINNGGDEYQEYQLFRDFCKQIADEAPQL